MTRRLVAALPNLAALASLLTWAHTAPDMQLLQPEPLSLHLYGAILWAVVVWSIARGLVAVWRR